MFRFRFHRTARVDVDVEPVSERVLMLNLNAPSPSSKPHVQLSYDSSLAPQKTPWITHRCYAQYDVDLPSESEGRRVFIVNNFRHAKPLVHRPWTFPHQAELMDDAFGSGLGGTNASYSFKTTRDGSCTTILGMGC